MIVVSFIWTEEEARKAHREMIRAAAPFVRYMPLFGVCLFCVPLLFWALNPEYFQETTIYAWLPSIFFGVWACAAPFLSQRQAVRNFRRSPNAGLRATWRIDSKSLATESHGSQATFVWGKVSRIKEVNDGFLLFFHPKVGNWLPNSGFASEADLDQFRELIAESGVRVDR